MKNSLTFALFIGIVAYALKSLLPKYLLPYGASQTNYDVNNRPKFSDVDYTIQTLGVISTGTGTGAGTGAGSTNSNLVKIYERIKVGQEPILVGPETVVIDHESNIYALAKGNIIQLTNIAKAKDSDTSVDDSSDKSDNQMNIDGDSDNDNDTDTDTDTVLFADATIIAKSSGCPLGGKFVPNTKTMYFADALLGLCRIDLSKPNPKVELVVSNIQLDDGTMSKIAFADDVDISKSGMVYFSDATDISPERDGNENGNKSTWDIMNAYKMDYFRGKRTGRLLRYDPLSDKVDILASGIWFANGIAVDEEERFIMISETSMFRLLKYHLTGPKEGQLEVMVDNLPGMVDGADCSGSYCYAPLPSTCPPILKFLLSLPPSVEAWLMTLFMMLPKNLTPKPTRYGGVVEVTRGDDISPSQINRFFQDPKGEHIDFITGVTEHNGKLFLGSLKTNYIGVLDLDVPINKVAPFLIFSD